MPDHSDAVDAVVPDRLLLAIGDRYSIRLPGLASAGYDWTSAVVGHQPEGRAVVSVELAVAEHCAEADWGDATSYSLPIDVTVVALEPGQAVVRLDLARSWQSPPPLRRYDIQVTVKKD